MGNVRLPSSSRRTPRTTPKKSVGSEASMPRVANRSEVHRILWMHRNQEARLLAIQSHQSLSAFPEILQLRAVS